MPKVALHVEPLFPDFHKEWFRWALRMSSALKQSTDWEPVVVVGTRFKQQSEEIAQEFPPASLVYIDVSFVTDTLGLDSHTIVARMLKGNCAFVEKVLSDALRDCLGNSEVDLVVTWSPANYYRTLFPHARILYSEYAFFSRIPFTPSWYLDPKGPDGAAFLDSFSTSVLEQLEFGNEQEEWIRSARQLAKRAALNLSPYQYFVAELRKIYRRLVLLPLQSTSHYLFSSRTTVQTSQELICTVASELAKDTALIVTSHPFGDRVSEDEKMGIQSLFPNVVFAPILPREFGPSEFLAPAVDVIVSVSSKVAFLALFYEIPFLNLEKSYGNFFSAGTIRDGLRPVSNWSEPPHYRKMLYWILTRYNVPEEVFFSPDWLVSALTRLHASEEDDVDAFTVFENEGAILSRLEDATRLHKPVFWQGQPASEFPEAVRENFRVHTVPFDANTQNAAGNLMGAVFTGPSVQGPGVVLSPGSLRFTLENLHASDGFESVSFDFCLDRGDSEWIPLVWVGDPTRTWEQGRTLAVYYHRDEANLAVAVGTPSASLLSCRSPSNGIELGRWYSVNAYIFRSWSIALLVVDGIVESVSDFPKGQLPAPSHISVGRDPHFPETPVWCKIANLKSSWPIV